MNAIPSPANTLAYGRKLINAGINGFRNGHEDLGPGSISNAAVAAVPESLALAAVGAALGVLPALLVRRRPRVSTTVALGALCSAAGFCLGFSWKTRKVASSLANSALREVRKAKDEHWLELNPIDYA
jgi:hypothetical protein